MRKLFSNYFLARFNAILTLASVMILLLCLADPDSFWEYLCLSELAALTILMLHPLSSEELLPSLHFQFVAIPLLIGAFALTLHFGLEPAYALLVPPFLLLAYKLFRSRRKYAQVRLLFRRDTVWCSIEDNSLDIYLSTFMTACILVICISLLQVGEMCFLAMAILLGLFVAAMYARAFTGRTMILSTRDEDQVQAIIRNNLRSDLRPEDSDEYMKCLYEKAVNYMENTLPFLDPEFNQDVMARVLFSNKLYLSRAINAFSGFNFRQFVNYYRINYSLALMKEDPNLTVAQLAMRSGFHSVVTYNIAFKMHKRTTPGEFFRENYNV